MCLYIVKKRLDIVKTVIFTFIVTREHSHPIKNEIVNVYLYFTEMVLRDQRLLESIWTVLLRLAPAQLMLLSNVKKKRLLMFTTL